MPLTRRIASWCWFVLLTATLAACGGKPAPDSAPGKADSAADAGTGQSARTLPIPDGEGGSPHGQGGMESPAPPIALSPPPSGSGSGAKALVWRAPASWISEPPASPMRRAQFRVPGSAGDGECAVFYFGPGQGGDPMSNARRWAGQFTRPDGTPAADDLKTRTYEVGPIAVLEVEVAGTYDGGMTMTAEPSTPKPGSMLLGAIAEGPDANWFFKLTGPEKTVLEQRAAFGEMVRSLRPGG